jgi:hypothetical protein
MFRTFPNKFYAWALTGILFLVCRKALSEVKRRCIEVYFKRFVEVGEPLSRTERK